MNWKVLFYSRFSGIEGRTIFWTFVLINSLVFIAATIASYIAHDPLIIAAARLLRAEKNLEAAQNSIKASREALCRQYDARIRRIRERDSG